ncbi:sulfite exporter TauE/SafE family protein [Gracilibacillus sp. YIM 98692]|uniref:sulfite exporter TauE/SafE family protein n=1 Tax=Gracilibacillus sp. YIM 98692 TaxID=2663532 RepID=UPI001F09D747|nr:sulfite exporter TauE/SafE family protein [Gracilibacillus sp. YIM 98692]
MTLLKEWTGSFLIIALCFLIGLLSAFIGSIVGFGGGVILVPILLILHTTSPMFEWAEANTVVGISLIIMVFTAMSSTYAYAKVKRIDYKSGMLFILGSLPGGILGAWLNQFVETKLFSLFLGIFILLIFSMFFFKSTEGKKATNVSQHKGSKWMISQRVKLGEKEYQYTFSIITAVALSFLVGALSGFFGIGGGSLMVPAMILFFAFPPHIATATSMFMILSLSIVSSSTHIFLGHIEWQYVWAFIPGAWIGGTLGAKVNQHMTSRAIAILLRLLLLFIGLRLIWQGLW